MLRACFLFLFVFLVHFLFLFFNRNVIACARSINVENTWEHIYISNKKQVINFWRKVSKNRPKVQQHLLNFCNIYTPKQNVDEKIINFVRCVGCEKCANHIDLKKILQMSIHLLSTDRLRYSRGRALQGYILVVYHLPDWCSTNKIDKDPYFTAWWWITENWPSKVSVEVGTALSKLHICLFGSIWIRYLFHHRIAASAQRRRGR